jgi:hypothetical protein
MKPKQIPILALRAYSCAVGQTEPNPTFAAESLMGVRAKLMEALHDKSSQLYQLLRNTGFCTVTLMGLHQYRHMERFDGGLCGVVCENGTHAVIELETPDQNGEAALRWINRALSYCQWCVLVEQAHRAGERPPVLELALHEPWFEAWIGAQAHRWFNQWKAAHLQASAERVKAAQAAG